MNVKNVKKWIKALESGKYKQAVGCLQLGGEFFCCLGVACKVSRCELKTGTLKIIDGEDLSHDQPTTDLNDMDSKSFTQIASYLKKKKVKAYEARSRKKN